MEQQCGAWFPLTLAKSSVEESRAVGDSNHSSFFLGRASGIIDILEFILGGSREDMG